MKPRAIQFTARMSAVLLGPQTLPEKAHRLAVELGRFFGADSCIIRTLERDGNLKLLAALGVEGMTIAPMLPAFYGISRGILEERHPVVIEDAATHPLTSQLYAKGRLAPGRFMFESYAGAPLLGHEQPVGIIGVYACHARLSFDEEELNVLQILANQLGLLIEEQRLRDDLERRVSERTDVLTAARDSAHKALRAKAEILTHLSEQLRAPLSVLIRLSGQLAAQEEGTGGSDSTAAAVLRTATRLEEALKEAQDFSAFDSGHFSIMKRPTKPAELLQPTIDLFRPQIEAKGLRFDVSNGIDFTQSLMVDATRINQICLHLMSNALKFTQKGYIALSLQYGVPPGGWAPSLIITVEDSGIGIPDTLRTRIFEPFFRQVEADTDNTASVGLGLSIVDRLVRALEGTIEVTSAPGGGTRFTVCVWAKTTGKPAAITDQPPSAERTRAESSKARVLLVDSSEAARAKMIQLLNAEGIEAPLLVETGEQALDVVATQPPVDVIIVGEYIGRLDQIAFCEALRLGATVSSQPPIVGVVGSVTDSYLNQLLGAGMNAFISKPVTADRVREILGRYSS